MEIKTFGAIDERSLKQLERCMQAGDAEFGGGADEAPEAYKRLPDVLAAHAGSIRVTHTLRPLGGVAMAGREVVDPYRD